MSVDPAGNRAVESSAWIERMIWRNTFLVIFLVGLVLFVYTGGGLIYLALIVGGLVPGLFLMAREQGERHVEAQRHAMAPEARRDDELPHVPGVGGAIAPAFRPADYPAQYPGTYRGEVPYGGRPYDDRVPPPEWDHGPDDDDRGAVVRRPTELDPDTDDGRGGRVRP